MWWFRNVEFRRTAPRTAASAARSRGRSACGEGRAARRGRRRPVRALLPRKSTSADLARVMATVQPLRAAPRALAPPPADFPQWPARARRARRLGAQARRSCPARSTERGARARARAQPGNVGAQRAPVPRARRTRRGAAGFAARRAPRERGGCMTGDHASAARDRCDPSFWPIRPRQPSACTLSQRPAARALRRRGEGRAARRGLLEGRADARDARRRRRDVLRARARGGPAAASSRARGAADAVELRCVLLRPRRARPLVRAVPCTRPAA